MTVKIHLALKLIVGAPISLAVLITALPSSLFIKPYEVEIDGFDVKVWRDFPLYDLVGPVTVSYVEVVRGLQDKTTCSDNNAKGFKYNNDENGHGKWSIEHWASSCMTHHFEWSAKWRVRWFGIGMRAVRLKRVFAGK